MQNIYSHQKPHNLGVSVYTLKQLKEVNAEFPLLSTFQILENICDRRLIYLKELVDFTNKGNVVNIRSVFLQGLLLMKAEEIPSKFNRWSSVFDSWYKFLDDQHISSLDACLKYTLSFSEISNVIVGLDNLAQLHQFIEASKGLTTLLPNDFQFNDADLINPARWSKLT